MKRKTRGGKLLVILCMGVAVFGVYHVHYDKKEKTIGDTPKTVETIFRHARAHAALYCDSTYRGISHAEVPIEEIWDIGNPWRLTRDELDFDNQYFHETRLKFEWNSGGGLRDDNVQIVLLGHPYIQKKIGVISAEGNEIISSETLDCSAAAKEATHLAATQSSRN